MRKTLLALLASACIVGAFENPAHSATFEPIAGGKSLVMTGEVVEGDAERLAVAYLDTYQRYGYAPERIFLNSHGGSVYAGFEVASFVQETGLHTVVGRTDECYSICTVIFAAGSHRAVFPTSRMGVHSASRKTASADGQIIAEEDATSLAFTLLMARVLVGLGAPDSVVIKTIATPGDSITYLTLTDLVGWVELIQ